MNRTVMAMSMVVGLLLGHARAADTAGQASAAVAPGGGPKVINTGIAGPADMAKRAAELKNLKWGMFICWSFSTFSGKEWTPGVKDISFFKAKEVDTDQWAKTAKEAGMGYILFLTKHHDGFCLWDTKTTERKVTKAPLGRDVLAELKKSCDTYGIKLALYFSEGEFNDNKDYHPGGYTVEMKKAQLKELLTQYGPIEYIWFDHAQTDGGLNHVETTAWCKQFQPGCLIGYNHGQPAGDIRLGEMGGPSPLDDLSGAGFGAKDAKAYKGYLAAEFTYPILPGHQGGAQWFYSLPKHDNLCLPAEKLYKDYLGAVKHGNIFSIDIGPDYNGKLRDIDVQTLRKVGEMIRSNPDTALTPLPAATEKVATRPQDLGKEFITNAKFGIFVHYTVEYAHLLGKPEPAVWDLDAKAEAFDVKAFADAVEGMGAQYVTLTAFHAAMYLLAPSKVMVDAGLSKHQAKRDLLGEVADELNKRGIALCLYVHPTDQHDLSQQERALFGWGPEVNGLPGPKLGEWPNPKWDAFLLGLFKEISLRYGKRVAGYWIDQHSGKVFPDAGRLAVALRAGNPEAVIWQNAGAYVPAGLSLESAWPASEGGDPSRGAKDQNCILPTDNAWFLGKKVQIPAPEVFRGVVRCAGTPGQKGGVHVALTPYADAYAPPVKQMMDDFGKLWRERKVSLLSTRPSKILQLEQKSNPWEVVATDSADGSTVYVHVMIPPAGQTIHLPPLNDGRKIITASLLIGGKEVKFTQAEDALELSLPENVKWDPVDTVIALKVGPAFKLGVILSENARLEISSTCGHDVVTNHARLFAGDKLPFAFHTDNEKNPWAKVDLGAVMTVRTVEIENRDGEQERTKGLVMSISEDGEKWQEVWQAKSWASTWIVRVIQPSADTGNPGRKARFIKLETRGESPRPLVLKRVTVFGIK